ncbi:hypothetical protein BX666DRAFT_1348408 [Dichotomocladium elegans]|nr:hypothetical protein BX666DRAFT_1348408 [Dichotomocladium elegans]
MDLGSQTQCIPLRERVTKPIPTQHIGRIGSSPAWVDGWVLPDVLAHNRNEDVSRFSALVTHAGSCALLLSLLHRYSRRLNVRMSSSSAGKCSQDVAGPNCLELIKYLCVVLLQDAAVLKSRYPRTCTNGTIPFSKGSILPIPRRSSSRLRTKTRMPRIMSQKSSGQTLGLSMRRWTPIGLK